MYGLGVSRVLSNCHQMYFLTVTVLSELSLFPNYLGLRWRSDISIMNKLVECPDDLPRQTAAKTVPCCITRSDNVLRGIFSPIINYRVYLWPHLLLRLHNTLTCLPGLHYRLLLERSKRRVEETFWQKVWWQNCGNLEDLDISCRYLFILCLCPFPLLLCPFHTFTYFAWHGLQ